MSSCLSCQRCPLIYPVLTWIDEKIQFGYFLKDVFHLVCSPQSLKNCSRSSKLLWPPSTSSDSFAWTYFTLCGWETLTPMINWAIKIWLLLKRKVNPHLWLAQTCVTDTFRKSQRALEKDIVTFRVNLFFKKRKIRQFCQMRTWLVNRDLTKLRRRRQRQKRFNFNFKLGTLRSDNGDVHENVVEK